MAGCASPVTLFHKAEGGDIAKERQPPPGSDLPYPNLASVPPRPVPLTASQQEEVQAQLAQARAAPGQPTSVPEPASPQALDDLVLPSAAPPLPQVPGINLPATPSSAAVVMVAAPAPVKPPDGAPVSFAFAPKSAILSNGSVSALRAMAAARGSAGVLVGGFGGPGEMRDSAALTLALWRARRIADALTAAGVPPAAITLTASAGGSGGFAQLVY